jgi:hypothetical protein
LLFRDWALRVKGIEIAGLSSDDRPGGSVSHSAHSDLIPTDLIPLKFPELSLANIYSYLKIPITLDGTTLSGDHCNSLISKSDVSVGRFLAQDAIISVI